MQNGILSETINNAIIQIGDIDDTGKGRHFVSRFIKDGLVKIEGHGIVLLKKETLDASLPSMVGTPVIIQHQNVTKSNADKLRIGTISNAYFNEPDGWYYCEGIIWDDEAKDLIDKGWSVSCSYDFLAYNDEGGVENNIKYDKEFTQLNFTHLAIVDNPRYERANIVFNCKVENDKWITIKPHGDDSDDYRRLKLEDGESPKEAIERVYKKEDKKQSDKEEKNKYLKKGDLETDKVYKLGNLYVKPFVDDDGDLAFYDRTGAWGEGSVPQKFLKSDLKNLERVEKYDKLTDKELKFLSEKGDFKQKEPKQSDTKDGSKDISKEEHAKIKEQVSKMSDDELVKAHFESQKGYESETPRTDSMTKHEATYGEVAQELKRRTGRGFSSASTESEIKEALSKAKFDSKGEKKYNYTLTKREVEANKMLGGMADTGNYYTNGEFAIDKKYLNIKGQEPTKKEEIEKSLKHILKGDSTDRYTPVKDFEIGELKREYGKPIKVAKYSYYDEKYGYERHIYLNKKYNDLFKNFDLKFGGEAEPVFAYKGKDIVGVVMPINAREQSYSKTVNNEIEEELTEDKNQLKLKIDNSKEQDMALLEEIKKLITKVENNKENDEMIDNEKVDKRKLIDEVAGIMKSAGCDDEDIRTAIGKMEKIGYDKSEDGSADNKKVKNEEPEKKDDVDDKKVDNEDAEDEKKVDELKKEEKEDVDNKCKNSKSSFDKINEIYNSIKQVSEEKTYVSRQEKLDNAVEYFK